MRRVLAAALLLLCATASAADYDYSLQPRQVAPDTYVFVGKTEDFDTRNGGNIVNTGFVVTRAGVVVIDTGPSRRYGAQMRAAIRAVTAQPVVRVFITHHHPDHGFGNQAYADVPIAALPDTIRGFSEESAGFADNMYRMNGEWMRDTEPVPPAERALPGRVTLGGHEFELLALRGHTAGDLAVFDRTSGVLFAGDLVFHGRALTTPHADPAPWLAALDTLEQLPFKVLVPGHGEPASDARAIRQTRDYLVWLRQTLTSAAARGLDMTEVLALPIAEPFAALALVKSEYRRSVAHMYPALEQTALKKAVP